MYISVMKLHMQLVLYISGKIQRLMNILKYCYQQGPQQGLVCVVKPQAQVNCGFMQLVF